MHKTLKRTALALVGLVAAGAGVVATGLFLAESKMQRHVDVAVQSVPYTLDTDALARGRYLYASRGCTVCACTS